VSNNGAELSAWSQHNKRICSSVIVIEFNIAFDKNVTDKNENWLAHIRVK